MIEVGPLLPDDARVGCAVRLTHKVEEASLKYTALLFLLLVLLFPLQSVYWQGTRNNFVLVAPPIKATLYSKIL